MTNFMRLLHAVYTFESLNTDDEKGLVRVLRRTHENLGHPSTPRFVSMLKAARASEKCIQLAKGLSCTTCREMTTEKSHNVSKAIKDLRFHDVVCMDTFEVELPTRKLKFLNMCDMATRFQICVPLWKGIEVKKVRQGYRRAWKRWAGTPKTVITDGGPEFSEAWTDLLTHDSTNHHVTAAYSPWQNGMWERLGGIWQTAFSKAMVELDPQNKVEIEEIADQVCNAHNTR